MGVDRIDISHLRLQSSSRAAVRGLLTELEDAFRTASWPVQSDIKGTVQVRKLALGRIAAGAARQGLALHLARALRDVPMVYAKPGRAVPAAAEAICWGGPVEKLAGALIAHATARALPWWAAATLPRPVHAEPALRRVARKLGTPGDTQSVLAALIVVLAEADAPTEALVPLLRLIEGVLQHDVPHLQRNAQAMGPGPEFPDAEQSILRETPDAVAVRNRRCCAQLLAAVPTRWRKLVAALIEDERIEWTIKTKVILLALRHLRGPSATQRAFVHTLQQHPERLPSPEGDETGKPAAEAAQTHTKPTPTVVETNSAARVDAPEVASEASENTLETPIVPQGPYAAPQEATRLGGVAVMINVLSALGLDGADNAWPDVNLRVLRRLLERCGDDAEPILQAIPDPETAMVPDDGYLPIMVPAPHALPATLYLHRIKGAQGRRALCLGRGRAPVAIVDATALRRVRKHCKIRRALCPMTVETVQDQLTNGVALLVQRLCRHLVQTPWRGVLYRDAWLATSVTHIDLTCDLDHVRLAERRAGLDLSPGWVPWLGRVVTLNFEPFTKTTDRAAHDT